MRTKKWAVATVAVLLAVLLFLTSLTVVVDPFFHYHAPLKGLAYPINMERYQNDGIVKHFTYDAVITGSSMTQNFQTSEFDALFGTNSIKVPFSGGYYKEVNDNLAQAFEYNPDIQYVLRCLDYNNMPLDKDANHYDDRPEYLYDNNLFNDTAYVLNKDILLNNTLQVLKYTLDGNTTTPFDEYSRWGGKANFGKEAVDKTFTRRAQQATEIKYMTEADIARLEANLAQNVTNLVAAHPNTTFYLFFPPYSIYYWEDDVRAGSLEWSLEAEKRAIEILLEYDNVRLFAFLDEFDIITNLDNYMDMWHYSSEVNSQILQWMAAGEHRLTKDNYLDYCARVREFYTNYDYDSLFE